MTRLFRYSVDLIQGNPSHCPKEGGVAERYWPYSSVGVALLLLALAPFRCAAQTSNSSQPSSPSYVGADTCKTCHEDIFKGVQRTRHWNSVLKLKGGVEAHSCETCHGPGAEHVNGGGEKSKIFVFQGAASDAINARCLSCHERNAEHARFLDSPHATNGVSCLTCHNPHFAKERRALLVEKQPELCYGCHADQKSDFAKPFRHRVNEGLVRCSDCHSPHGTTLPHALRATASQDQVCFKCHRNLQGPFVFEHVPVKTEGCTTCHQPHGSVNPRMLIVNQVNLLCLQCHTLTSKPNTRARTVLTPPVGGPTGPPQGGPDVTAVHDQTAKFQACTICHQYIHGSNGDPNLMK